MTKFILATIVLVFLLVYSCDAQPIHVSVPYSVEVGIDSAYIFLWKGDNINLCPFIEDMDYSALNQSGLVKYNVNISGGVLNFDLPADGKVFKVAGVVFADQLSADLATSAFYTLPKKPGKMTIGNITLTR